MDCLPFEVVIKILSYLKSSDLMRFCMACENYCYLLEKDIVQKTDLSGEFEFQNIDLCKYIWTKLHFKHIRILNINYIYWIIAQELRILIEKLENLEVLYALDTKLGLKDKDIAAYTKLKKLAVSVEGNQFTQSTVRACKNFKALKSLCLKIMQKIGEYSGICLFFQAIMQIEELWIIDEAESTMEINYGQMAVLTLVNLKKLVIKSKSVLPFYDFNYAGLLQVFECKRNQSSTELVFEKILIETDVVQPSIFEPAEDEYEGSWQMFQSLRKDPAYGPKESREIFLTKSVKDVYFDDLNFCHTIILCNYKLVLAARKILSSKNCSKLKRLSFRSCFLQCSQEVSKEESTSGFKKSRIGVQTTSAFHPFQSTADNLKHLRELEILTCLRCVAGAVVSAYPIIRTFEYLEKLVLDVPILLDGSFLKEVFINCSYLESLYLFCKTQNDKFVTDLCQNLKYSQNLRHFRLDHRDIPITKLLSGFNEIEHKKLLRICVNCDNLRSNDDHEAAFSTFMKVNPQLVFCCFVISKNTNKQNTDIQQVINKFKDGNTAKVFFVRKDISSFNGVFPIPAAHHDIIFYRTNVAVINIDEF